MDDLELQRLANNVKSNTQIVGLMYEGVRELVKRVEALETQATQGWPFVQKRGCEHCGEGEENG